jgi:hypothetical protein
MTEIGCSNVHSQELFNAMGEKADWCRVFAGTDNWNASSGQWKIAVDASKRGEKVALSFKGDPKTLADSRIAGIANGIKAANMKGGALIFFHEPEDDVESGSFTAADWRAAMKKTIAVAKPIIGPLGWRIGPCLMSWTLNPSSGRNPEDYWVPEADLYMWDPYNFAGASPAQPYATKDPSTVSPQTVYGAAVSWSKGKGKPYAICETACSRRQADTNGVERTKWMKMVTDSKILEGFDFVIYFENGVQDNRCEFRLTNEPASRNQFSAWRTGVVAPPVVPTISSVTPNSAAVGAALTIAGSNLGGATVKFNGVNATVTSNTATEIKTTVPAGATTGPITVTTSGGAATSSFTVSTTPPGETDAQKIARLEAENSKLKADLAAATAALATANAELATAKSDLAAANTALATAKDDLKYSTDKLAEIHTLSEP